MTVSLKILVKSHIEKYLKFLVISRIIPLYIIAMEAVIEEAP